MSAQTHDTVFETRALNVALGAGRTQSLVLHDLSLSLPQGRWISIVGPNGAGKSTLLKALAGLLPYQGEVRFLGRSLAQWPRRERARQLAWLGQNETVTEDMRVWDVAMLGRIPHQDWLAPPSETDKAAVETALRATQAWDLRTRPLGQLSGGERQRGLLARALAVDAPVLLMDEPLSNLDPPHQADCLALIREQVAQGRTVISVLHEISLALYADEMLILAEGRLQHQGACNDPATHRALEGVFDQRIRVCEFNGQPIALPCL